MRLTFVSQNWTLKLFSLIAASLLFVFVSVESATPVDVDFRIDYRMRDDMMLTGDPPSVLHSTLQGPWANFRSFEIGQLEPVVVELGTAEPGKLRHRIETVDINPPGGMKVISFRPAELELELDCRVERQVPVEPDISERPAFGFEILAVRVEPARVRVVGPQSETRKLDFVSTRPIDVNGREDDVTVEVDLRPPATPGMRLLDRRVRVFIEIGEEYVQRTLPALPVVVDNAPKGARAEPPNVSLVVKGPRRLVDGMDPAKQEVYVDALPELTEGRKSFEKAVALRGAPDRMVLVGPVPKVTVQLPKVGRKAPRK